MVPTENVNSTSPEGAESLGHDDVVTPGLAERTQGHRQEPQQDVLPGEEGERCFQQAHVASTSRPRGTVESISPPGTWPGPPR